VSRVTTLFLLLAALAVALAALVDTPQAKRDAPRLDVRNVSGEASILNSREGLPIVSMSDMKPGDTASGEVTLENDGTARGRFVLAPLDLVSDPGPGGGKLADNLIVRVYLTQGSKTTRRYAGRLSKMGEVAAGKFKPGVSGTYTFEVMLQDTGVPPPPTPSRPVRGDNKYQGATATVTFGWATSPL
jgi:hypothetical protein